MKGVFGTGFRSTGKPAGLNRGAVDTMGLPMELHFVPHEIFYLLVFYLNVSHLIPFRTQQ